MATTTSTTPLSLADLRDSVKRIQNEGERFLQRLRRDASDLISGKTGPTDVIGAIRNARAQALSDLDARRVALRARVEGQLTDLAERVRHTLNAPATRDFDILSRRVADLERHVEKLRKDLAA